MPIADYYRNNNIRLKTAEIEAALEPLNWESDVFRAARDLVQKPDPNPVIQRVTRAVLFRHHRVRKDIVGYLHLAAFGCKLLRLIWQDADADRALFLITELVALEDLARKLAAKEDRDENEDKFLEMINL